MTEPDQVREANQESHPVRHDKPDGILQLLVQAAHSGAGQVGVTLTVVGTVVSGVMVGRDQWFQELAAWEERVNPGGGSLARTMSDAISSAEREGELSPSLVEDFAYIHLVRAYVFGGPERLPADQGMFWRGRLSHVSGWSLGTLTVD